MLLERPTLRKPGEVAPASITKICARVDGIWMFRHKLSEPLMNAPSKTGRSQIRLP
jgi:hypothetical protein